VTMENRSIPNPSQQLSDVVLRLRNQHIDRRLAVLTHRASQPERNEEERVELLRQQQELWIVKRQGLAELKPA